MSVAVIDNATDDLISIQETVHGPHPLRDGVRHLRPVGRVSHVAVTVGRV
jgi:hypothetical protein